MTRWLAVAKDDVLRLPPARGAATTDALMNKGQQCGVKATPINASRW